MHPFFRVLFYSSPFLTLTALVALAYTGGRFALAWGKISVVCLKITTGVVYILVTVSWSIVAVVLISQWILGHWLVYAFVILAFLAPLAAGAIAEKAEEYGGRRRNQLLDGTANSAAHCSN